MTARHGVYFVRSLLLSARPVQKSMTESHHQFASIVPIEVHTVAVAAQLVHHCHRVKASWRLAGRPVILADALSPKEDMEHRRLRPTFRRPRAGAQPARFPRARLLVAGRCKP